MRLSIAAALCGIWSVSFAGDVFAQEWGGGPVQRDDRRERRLERRIERDRLRPVHPDVGPTNPGGVVEFDRPGGVPDDDIDEIGPMVPGSPDD